MSVPLISIYMKGWLVWASYKAYRNFYKLPSPKAALTGSYTPIFSIVIKLCPRRLFSTIFGLCKEVGTKLLLSRMRKQTDRAK